MAPKLLTSETLKAGVLSSMAQKIKVAKGNIALPPFSNLRGDADVILRTSDKNDFYVHKSILGIASSVFIDMYAVQAPVPQPTTADTKHRGGSIGHANPVLPVITVDEDSQTINHLLRVIYPVYPPDIANALAVVPILQAAQKYKLSPVTLAVEKALTSLCHMQSEVLSTYAVACRFHLYKAKEVASVAFSASLPTRAEDGSGIYWRRIHRIDEFVPAMLTIPARAYYNILVGYQASKTGCDAEQGFSVFMSFIMSMDHPPQPSPVDQRPQCPQPSPIFAPLPPPPFDHRAPRTFTPDDRLILTQCTNGQDMFLIRSVDGTDFHLNAYIISFASPVIADMLTAATASSNSDGGQAVAGTAGLRRVDLPEWSDTLSDLLQLCHPLPNPEVKTFRLRTLLHAALKYKVQHAIAFVKEVYVQMAEQKPLHVYFIATSHDWQDVVKLAAIYSVYGTVWPKMDELYGEIGTLLDELPASAYRHLLVYCQKFRNLILASRASSPKGAEAPYWSDVEGTQWASDEESKVWRALHTKAFEKAMSGQAEANVDAEEVDLTALPTGKDPRDGATVTRSGNTTVRCSHREIMHVVEKLMKVPL